MYMWLYAYGIVCYVTWGHFRYKKNIATIPAVMSNVLGIKDTFFSLAKEKKKVVRAIICCT